MWAGCKTVNIWRKNSDQLKPPKWVNVSKRKFNEILSIITKDKNFEFKANVDGREITLHNAECLLKSIASGKIDTHEFKKSTTILLMM